MDHGRAWAIPALQQDAAGIVRAIFVLLPLPSIRMQVVAGFLYAYILTGAFDCDFLSQLRGAGVCDHPPDAL